TRGDGTEAKASLHGGQLCEFRRVFPQKLPGFGGKQAVLAVFARAVADAAVVFIAKPDERFGIGHGQCPEKNGVYEGKDAGVGANAEGQRQNRGGGETRRLEELAKCVAGVLHQGGQHRSSLKSAIQENQERGSWL